MDSIIFVFLFLLTSETSRIEPLHDQEVAARGRITLDQQPSSARFAQCVPQESKPFKGVFSSYDEEFFFTKKERDDLMECSSKRCAFNFLPPEVIELEKITTLEGRKAFFKNAYQKRLDFKYGPDPKRSPLFIRYRDRAFERCGEGSALQDLLNNRPLRDLPFRLTLAKYNRNMRPTTRLSQGAFWTNKAGICYAEALVFSNHYDVDRVEVWSLQGQELQLEVRHRIDLLNSWLRRLNKEHFIKETELIVDKQINDAKQCLQKK